MRIEAKKIRNAARVIAVPMCKKNMGKSDFAFSKN